MNWSILLSILILSVQPFQKAYGDIPFLESIETSYEILPQDLTFIEDPTTGATLNNILARQAEMKQPEKLNIGFSTSGFWYKIPGIKRTQETSLEHLMEVSYPLLDHVDFYIVDATTNELIKHHAMGDAYPYNRRPGGLPTFTIPLNPNAGQTLDIYLRISGQGSLRAPITIWESESIQQNNVNYFIMNSIYFGFMGSLIIYNFFILLSVRKVTYLIYIVWMVIHTMNEIVLAGLNGALIDGSAANLKSDYLPFGIGFANLAAILFAVYFLQLEKFKKIRTTLGLPLLGFMLVILSAPFVSYKFSMSLIVPCQFLAMFVIIFAAYYCLIKGVDEARFYALAWTAYLFGTIIFALNKTGAIPDNIFTENSMKIGAIFEGVLISFALADKINTLREKLAVANQQLKAHINKVEDIVAEKTADIRSILRSIDQGIFMVDSQLRTHQDYSKYLERVVESSSLSNKPVMSSIFHNFDLDPDQIDLIKSTLLSCIHANQLAFKFNQHNFPRLVTRSTENEVRQFEFDWNPVINHKQNVEKMLVTIRDVTSFNKLIDENRKYRKDQTYLGEIIAAGIGKTQQFLQAENKLLNKVEVLLQPNQVNHSGLNEAFMNVHTLKGIVRDLKFSKLKIQLHESESALAAMKKDGKTDNLDEIVKVIANFRQECHIYRELCAGIANQQQSHLDGILLESSDIETLVSEFQSEVDKPEQSKAIKNVRKVLFGNYFVAAKQVIEDIYEHSKSIAAELRKREPILKLQDRGVLLSPECAALIRNTFGHLFRNILDHGIETEEDRTAIGKNPVGSISIILKPEKSGLTMEISDDGCGLNLNKIRDMAIDKEILSDRDRENPQSVADLIFSPELSTSVALTEVSGRGVGMGAVKKYIEDEKGQVSLIVREENIKNVPFQLRIQLPPHFFAPEEFLAS